jgi:hypothetical protein
MGGIAVEVEMGDARMGVTVGATGITVGDPAANVCVNDLATTVNIGVPTTAAASGASIEIAV